MAEFNKVASTDVVVSAFFYDFGVASIFGRGEIWVIRQRGVAAHAEIVLHPAFGGQAVVVPPHGVKNFFALHALVAGDGVSVGVGKNMAHVERTADRGWRGVNGEHLGSGFAAVKAKSVLVFPGDVPFLLNPFEGWLGRDGGGP